MAGHNDWHNDASIQAVRQTMQHNIFGLFQQRKPGLECQFKDRLPDFITRLEDALFRAARTKEEYEDLDTLEARLQDVAKRLVNPSRALAAGSNNVGAGGTAQQMNGGMSGGMLQPGVQQAPNGATQQQPQAAPGANPQLMQQQNGFHSGPGMMPGMGMMMPTQQQQQQQQQQGGFGGADIKAEPMMPGGMVPLDGMGQPVSMGGRPAGFPLQGQSAPGAQPGQPQQAPGQPPGVQAPPQQQPQQPQQPQPGAGLMGAMGQPGGQQLGTPQLQPMQALQPGMPTNTYGNTLMSNGAPVLRKEGWASSPSLVPMPSGAGPGVGGGPLNGMGGGGFMPTGGSMGGSMGGGMVPTGAGGMMPTNGTGGMMPAPGNGMQQQGMVPMMGGPGMAPPPLGGPPGGSGMVPTGMVPVSSGGMGGGPMGGAPGAFGGGMPGGLQQPGGGMGGMFGSMGPPGGPGGGSDDAAQLQANRQAYIQKQQRWLLFLRHCAKCQQSESQCQFSRSCRVGKELWQHILNCQNSQCDYPRCISSKDLLKHHQKCQNVNCPICTPVKEYVRRTKSQSGSGGAMPGGGGGLPLPGGPGMGAPQGSGGLAGQKRLLNGGDPSGGMMRGGGGVMGMPAGMMPNPGGLGGHMGGAPGMGNGPMGIDPEEPRIKRQRAELDTSMMSKNTGTSLLETFDVPLIKAHVEMLRAAATQQRNAAPPPLNPDDACSVCGQTKLTFEPPCLYCTQCGQRIKRGQTFHCTPADQEQIKGFWCHSCFSEHKGDKIPFDGAQTGHVRKVDLIKKKNDDEIEEGWVACDSCNAWVHQICGLFNKGRNNDNVHYLCPECLTAGLETGRRQRIENRPDSMLEARELPHCALSRLLENRLQVALSNDRAARAAAAGKHPEEVPGAEGLTVRVINNLMKRCEVKPKFAETFGPEGYPEAFPYRQRVVVLFQRMDGVDVALFCMYVQEYGSNCPPPNRNVVYLSYLDSVKYFRPELPAATGNISLRTFVYHQLLLGYLGFVRQLGYNTMFIWACPPLQGDDYIWYCHPSKQKTPRSDRLRAWYLDLLRKAQGEGTVVHLSTLWDTYFEGGRDHRYERCSITAIPYLDGDYWPGEVENLLANINDATRGVAPGKGGAGGGGAAARKGGKGKRYGAVGASTDEQLMGRLGEILGGNMREDFIVAHLREPCSFCRTHVVGGLMHRYVVPQGGAPPVKAPSERKFEGIKLEGPAYGTGSAAARAGPVTHLQLCEQCFGVEAARIAGGQKTRLPPGVSLTDLATVCVDNAQMSMDGDPDTENEFFDTRQAFLSLCQGNHYQFDTLRRAKHSSMMVLYHLHNPSAPAFASTCNTCGLEIEAGSGLRCTVCTDYDMCGACKARGVQHEHPLVPTAYRQQDETRTRLTEAERLERQQQLQRTMQLLVHACNCQNSACSSTSCRKVRGLFNHAVSCTQKVTGGCQLCKKMWCLLTLHAKGCMEPHCPVPRCKELKDLRRRQAMRMEKQRRQAYAAMLRNQYAANGSGEQL